MASVNRGPSFKRWPFRFVFSCLAVSTGACTPPGLFVAADPHTSVNERWSQSKKKKITVVIISLVADTSGAVVVAVVVAVEVAAAEAAAVHARSSSNDGARASTSTAHALRY